MMEKKNIIILMMVVFATAVIAGSAITNAMVKSQYADKINSLQEEVYSNEGVISELNARVESSKGTGMNEKQLQDLQDLINYLMTKNTELRIKITELENNPVRIYLGGGGGSSY